MEVDIYFGDDHKTKLPKNFRFVFNNINGITLTPDTLINFAAITKELQSDWTGIAETHIVGRPIAHSRKLESFAPGLGVDRVSTTG